MTGRPWNRRASATSNVHGSSLLLLPLVVLVMAACGGSDAPDAFVPTTQPATSSPDAATTVPEPASSTTPARGSLRPAGSGVSPSDTSVVPPVWTGGPTGSAEEAVAVADLASRLGVDESAVTIVSVEDVEWRSGAIGCPDPSMVYTQALVSGTRIVLEVAGTRYEYHSGGPRSIFLCENPEPPVGG